MRVLVTGRGSIAKRHVCHLRVLIPGVDIAVISGTGEIDPVFGPCTLLGGIDEGFAWRPDAVVIAGISSRHSSELVLCLERGIPCLAEKPLVTDRSQLRQLCELAGKNTALPAVLVGCNLRYLPALSKLRIALARDTSCRVLRAHLEVGQELTQWRPGRALKDSYSAFASQGGGVVFDLVHEIDMAHWLLGPLAVQASVGGHLSSLPIESNDVHVALLKTLQGAPVVVSLDYVSQLPVRRYALVTTSGTFIVDLIQKVITLETHDGRRVLNDKAEDFDIAQTYQLQMTDWLAAIANPAHEVVSSLADGVKTAGLMLNVYEAIA
ncbi:MAG: Gfo/Idh/MocA family oxidoreductase [Pseudomonadota bacterium]